MSRLLPAGKRSAVAVAKAEPQTGAVLAFTADDGTRCTVESGRVGGARRVRAVYRPRRDWWFTPGEAEKFAYCLLDAASGDGDGR